MKIGIISTHFGAPWGGSELLWAETARTALDQGHEVALILKRWPELPAGVRDLQSRGARVFLRSVDLYRRSSRVFERLIHPFPSIIRWRPEVVLVSQPSLHDLMYRNDVSRLLDALKVPYTVVVQQCYEYQIPIESEPYREAIVSFFRGARRVAFVAEGNRRAAQHQLATDLPNSCVVRNPVNLEGRGSVPWRSSHVARLACVARLLASDKGQDLLLEILGGEPWRSRPWELRLYGKGPDEAYLTKLARHEGIADRVSFRGHVGDIRSIWEENHLLVMPSRCEGTPLSMVEAMICGRPSVVTDVGGNSEWVVEPRNGFVAEAASVRSFGAALERAWAARSDWEAIGLQAHRDALDLIDPAPGRTLLEIVTAPDRDGPVAGVQEATRGPERLG